MRQFEAFCQFENRHIRDIRINFVAENFLQEEDVLEYSSGDCFFVTPSHKDLLINQKTKGAPPLNDERLCSTDGNVAYSKTNSNSYATGIWGKDFLATVFFLLVST